MKKGYLRLIGAKVLAPPDFNVIAIWKNKTGTSKVGAISKAQKAQSF